MARHSRQTRMGELVLTIQGILERGNEDSTLAQLRVWMSEICSGHISLDGCRNLDESYRVSFRIGAATGSCESGRNLPSPSDHFPNRVVIQLYK